MSGPKPRRVPKFYGRAVPIDGPRATITLEERGDYKRDVRVITGRDDDVYKPTTELLRCLYGHLGRGVYVPDDELLPRVAAFDRWLASVKEDAFDEGLIAGDSFIGNGGDAPNPYRKEEP